MTRADELEIFKREISLTEFAQSLGYVVVKKESSRCCTVMKGDNDKIIVATSKSDGHGIYFSVGDQRDSGSVIDFAQRRLGGSLGHVRKELRGWVSAASRPSPRRRPASERPAKPDPVDRDRAELLSRWAATSSYIENYLTDARGLDADLVAAWGVRQDASGNALFPHFDEDGVCGWEEKRSDHSRFCRGGQLGLTLTKLDCCPVQRIVVTEASIDAMSWAQLNGRPEGTVYCSLAGSVSTRQIDLMKAFISSASPGVEVVIATDADAPGDQKAQKLEEALSDLLVARSRPPEPYKDWNDVVREGVGQSLVRFHKASLNLAAQAGEPYAQNSWSPSSSM